MSTGDQNGPKNPHDDTSIQNPGDPFAELADILDTDYAADRPEAEAEGFVPAGAQNAAPRDERSVATEPQDASPAELDDSLLDGLDADLGREFEGEQLGASGKTQDGGSAMAAASRQSYASWLAPHAGPGSPAPGKAAATKPKMEPVVAAEPSTGNTTIGGPNPEPAAPQPASKPPRSRSDFDAALDYELSSALDGLSDPANPRESGFYRSEAFAPERSEPGHSIRRQRQYDEFDELIAAELAAMRTSQPIASDEAVASRSEQPASTMGEAPGTTASSMGESFSAQADAAEHGGRGVSIADERTVASIDRRDFASRGRRAGGGSSSMRRLAASVAALALLGGVGYYLLSGADIVGPGSGDVLIVAADKDPVKVQPKNPGGRSIPNQNQEVYQRVQSADADTQPTQQTLISAVEEPVDLPKEQDNGLPGVDLSPIGMAQAAEPAQSAEAAATSSSQSEDVLSPRKVRTLSVRADGTLDASEPSGVDRRAMVPAASQTPISLGGIAMGGSSRVTRSAGQASPAASTAVAPDDVPGTASARSSQTAESAQPAVAAADVPTPETAPAQPRRAAASETKPTAERTEVASVDPNAYYVQISSQPSEAAARQSMRTLSNRYAAAIGGRNVVIQSADIAGKGTYYRVRVATGSRDEAASVCSRLKSAGGSCFVSR